MGHFAGTTFGIGLPTISPLAQNLGSFSPFVGQGPGTQTYQQQQPYVQTLSSPFVAGGYGIGAGGIGPLPLSQVTQWLQIVPQQLQQLQLLEQQVLLHLQQLLQWVPAQLQQLQQLVQVVPHQVQQLQQQGQPITAGIQSPVAFGLVPHAFAGPVATHVM